MSLAKIYVKSAVIVLVLGSILGALIAVVASATGLDAAESGNFRTAKIEAATEAKWKQSQRELTGWRDDLGVRIVTVTDPSGQRSNHVCVSYGESVSCNIIPSER